MKQFVLDSVEYAEERHPGVKYMAHIELDETLTVRVVVFPYVESEEVQ